MSYVANALIHENCVCIFCFVLFCFVSHVLINFSSSHSWLKPRNGRNLPCWLFCSKMGNLD